MAVKEAAVEPKTAEVPKTFRVAEERPDTRKYHYLQRVVGPMALPDGTLDSFGLDDELDKWLNDGWRLIEGGIHFLGQHKGPDNNVHGYVYGYHLVKG
jgi:hypothetical protein